MLHQFDFIKIIKYFRVQTTLQEKLRKLQSELEAKNIANHLDEKSNSDVLSEIEIGEKELIELQHKNASREELAKMYGLFLH